MQVCRILGHRQKIGVACRKIWRRTDSVSYSPRVSDQDRKEADRSQRRITVNMLIGYNLAFFRRAAGLSQQQAGEELGWTNVAVSAAERSWNGKRVRKFDADEIANMASVLRVPISAFFLPPVDDSAECPYVIGSEDEDEPARMRDLLVLAMSEPTEDDHPAMRAYEERLVGAVNTYLDSGVAEALATRLKERAMEAQLAKALREARESRETLEHFWDALEGLISDNDLLQDILGKMLEATPEGRALLEEDRRQEQGELTSAERRRAWDRVPADHREWQSQLAVIGRELFGERGPAMRGEIDQVVAEARRRGIEGGEAAAVLLRHDGTYELVQPYADQTEEPRS